MRRISPLSFKTPEEAVNFFLSGEVKDFERVRDFGSGVEEFLNEFYDLLARELLKRSFSRDELIVQSVKYLEELDNVINRVFERVYEWFTLVVPEATRFLESPESFYKVVKKCLGSGLVDNVLKELGVKESYGLRVVGKDFSALRRAVEMFVSLCDERDHVRKYVEGLVVKLAPNTAKVATPQLAAKLISEAGGLKSLVLMPASTIQVLGAEKSLFKHLVKGTKPPKHGLIVQHPLIQRVGKSFRGKMARSIANKISLCVKIDFYGDDKRGVTGERLYKELEEKCESFK